MSTETESVLAIKRACEVCGSASALASALAKTPQFISQMTRGERPIPVDLCLVIERETRRLGRPVFCEALRPDIPWEVVRAQSAPAGQGA